MKLTCRSCQQPIPPEDINLDTVLAKCRSCHAVFDISGQVSLPKVPEAKLRRGRAEFPIPKRFVVEEGSGRLLIIYRWALDFRAIVVLMFVSIFPFTLIGLMLRPSVWNSRKLEEETIPVWGMMVSLLPALVLGIAIVWSILALILNKTTIQLEGRRLKIQHRPIPWLWNRDVDTTSFDQLYCVEGDSRRYDLMARCKDGTRLKLVKNLGEVEQALALERLLEKHLGIADRPIRGEIQDGFTS